MPVKLPGPMETATAARSAAEAPRRESSSSSAGTRAEALSTSSGRWTSSISSPPIMSRMATLQSRVETSRAASIG
jgi:hypothetical protein